MAREYLLTFMSSMVSTRIHIYVHDSNSNLTNVAIPAVMDIKNISPTLGQHSRHRHLAINIQSSYFT